VRVEYSCTRRPFYAVRIINAAADTRRTTPKLDRNGSVRPRVGATLSSLLNILFSLQKKKKTETQASRSENDIFQSYCCFEFENNRRIRKTILSIILTMNMNIFFFIFRVLNKYVNNSTDEFLFLFLQSSGRFPLRSKTILGKSKNRVK